MIFLSIGYSDKTEYNLIEFHPLRIVFRALDDRVHEPHAVVTVLHRREIRRWKLPAVLFVDQGGDEVPVNVGKRQEFINR